MSTATVRLGDVATFVRGITFKPADVLNEVTADAVGCMRTKNVQTQLDETDVWFLSKNFVANKNQVLQEGDLLVSTANSWNLVGKACWVPKLNYECTFGGFISALRATDALVDRRYLYYWFTSKKIQAKLRSFGNKTTNISNLSIKRANDLVIPLPPLAQQQRIAAILDKAAEIKAKREQAIAKLDELAQSTFVEMFGSSIENEGVELRSICDRVTDGTHQSPEWVDGGIPFIFISNIVNGEINLKTHKFISNNTYEELTRNCQINVGDILYTTVGSYGNVALVRDESKFAFQRHIAHIKPKQDIVNSRFMATMLGCTFVRRQVDKVARGVAQKTVNLGDLAKLKVICPPIKLQQEFAKRVELIEAMKVKQIKASVRATQLISSLQHQAFTTGFNA
jgi:type I restriction enzyme S subunit